MNKRTLSFIKKEKQVSLVLVLLGICFTALYFSAENVPPQYTYFFYTLTGFGLIFIFNYGYRYLFYSRRQKTLIPEDLTEEIIDQELSWLNVRIKEVEKYRIILQVFMAIGLVMVLIGFAGFMKQVLGSSGLGIFFGSAVWFAAELFSELSLKEYQNYLEK